jgi:hypothetical protein
VDVALWDTGICCIPAGRLHPQRYGDSAAYHLAAGSKAQRGISAAEEPWGKNRDTTSALSSAQESCDALVGRGDYLYSVMGVAIASSNEDGDTT